ncbi:DNA-processing protein DprA [Ramlibacter tataouinensis]|uniref:Smf protein n=1 Tax=Ramlibacter tataouinensis (strain ATCC BAA-407 / DSM 14655 / LMG 21543 / TTB310) TaxID=365046 RepID=F5Y241_RAMTT|nr:DNA-processing protein DprA [Ramlibacter tataouinensis]AEG94809.1 Smf protein [Ramlibacter tataouinensis TTB310]
MERDELAAWLRLSLTPQVGSGTARRLLAAFGLPQNIFAQSHGALLAVAAPAQAQALLAEPPGLAAQVEATARWLAQARAERTLLTLADAAYPAALLQTEDPPLMLYLAGRRDQVSRADGWPRAIAMVGSRNATPQGLDNARQFARAFAQQGWTVVSGLALGVDGASHEGALDGAAAGALATIAVVGTGLDRVYPRQHLELARRIAAQGLLVSEYPLGTPPLQPNFPKRNRIIAALSQGTLVVEAALQSGSLITARQAAEQGKEVFAIPGSIHSPQARGCHALIRQGAKLVETAQDVLEELVPQPTSRAAVSGARGERPAQEAGDDPVLESMGHDPVTLDALVARTGMPPPALQARLLELELQGQVGRLPGGLFQRVGSA